MGRILNTYEHNDGVTTILITRDDDKEYLARVLIDSEDLPKVLGNVYMSSKYPTVRKQGALQNIVMNHTPGKHVVVDHINNDPMDNRKVNLRIVSHQLNNTNRVSTRSNIGVNGISERSNGNYHYFRASVSDLSTVVTTFASGAVRTKRFSKQFNIKKLGRDEALKQAKSWLQIKKMEFGYLC